MSKSGHGGPVTSPQDPRTPKLCQMPAALFQVAGSFTPGFSLAHYVVQLFILYE